MLRVTLTSGVVATSYSLGSRMSPVVPILHLCRDTRPKMVGFVLRYLLVRRLVPPTRLQNPIHRFAHHEMFGPPFQSSRLRRAKQLWLVSNRNTRGQTRQ